MQTIAILGAGGNAGRAIAHLLVREIRDRLRLAGRTFSRLERLAQEPGAGEARGGVGVAAADASQEASLFAAFQGADLVLVASSTARHMRVVAEACLASGADCLDIIVSAGKSEILRALEAEIVRAGRCFITDAGFHPGLPAALVRLVGPEFDRLERAVVGSLIRLDWSGLGMDPSTVDEFLEEMRAIPTRCPEARETGFWVGGLMLWALETFSRPPRWSRACCSIWTAGSRAPIYAARRWRWSLGACSGIWSGWASMSSAAGGWAR